MNILILIPSLEIGGAEKQAVIDANILASQNHEITIAYSKIGPLIDILGSQVKRYKLLTSNQIIVQAQLFYYLIKNHFEIIHAHMFWAEKVVSIPALLTRHKVIFNEHGLGLWRKWYHRLIMRLISTCADKIVCSCRLNEKLRSDFENIPKTKLLTIYNSIETHDFRWSKLHRSTFTIGFVGRFHKVKRLHILIGLASCCKQNHLQVVFLLVGDGEETSKLKTLVQQNGLDDYIKFVGFKTDLHDEYKKMDLFVMPSQIEAFSVALLEAGSYGIPLLAFDVGGNSEIVLDNITGYLIKDGNLGDLFARIKTLYDDPDKVERLSISTKNYIQQHFSHTKRLLELQSLYKNVI